MFAKDYEWYLRHLTEHVSMKPSQVEFVDSIADWCREHGVREKDEGRPVRLVTGNGSGDRMLVASLIPDDVVEERINALRIRSQLKDNGHDRADRLNSATKKLAYLFLREFTSRDPGLAYDDLAADEWVFEQMERIGVFNP
jgi:hypothetical protein